MTPDGTGPQTARSAYLGLTMVALLWAANAVASRAAVGEVSPQALTGLRWAVTFTLLAVVARRQVMLEWRVLASSWVRVLVMGAFGYTVFASLFYGAGAYTSAINIALLQGSIPVLVIILNFLAYRVAISPGQAAGVLTTLVGAGIAATHGNLTVLTTLGFNKGDVFMLIACLLYAGYTVALPSRPNVSGIVFFTAMAAAAFLTSLPLMAVEWEMGRFIWPTAKGWMVIAFVALGPSLAAQLLFIRGVEVIGSNRAGVFVNLVPIFGAALAVLLIGEPFGLYNGVALLLVLGGIVMAERLGPKATVAAAPSPPR